MIVIADDITGAAEIAGIAFEHGQQVGLVCSSATSVCETTVIATDTRSMTEAEAIAETLRIANALKGETLASGARLFPQSTGKLPCVLFKKTDSALRGHVVAELRALMEATGYRRAVYLPANPSKGRIIRGGEYYINSTPIHETDFSFDPEFPARTSSLKERFPDAEVSGIVMPDAESADDIRHVIDQFADGQTLFAGAADLFGILLESRRSSGSKMISEPNRDFGNSCLILCGSTQSRALDIDIPVVPMPRTIYDGSDNLDLWDTSDYDVTHSLILTIPHVHRTGKEVAVHLRTVMAEMTRRLVARHRPEQLIIEGGATAWATLNALGWTQFKMERQVAPGVVQMRADNGTLVTLKPGSYPWGGLFK